MKNKIVFVFFTLLALSCNSKQEENKTNTINNTKKEIVNDTTSTTKAADAVHYQISVFDDPKFADRIKGDKEKLKKLSEEQLFSEMSSKSIVKLNEKQQLFFNTNSNYELLCFAKGNLFQESNNDYVFIVYDKENIKTKILLYNDKTSQYAELFKDIKVENRLENADCGSYSFGTLDYQFAIEHLIMNEGALKINPQYYLEDLPLKITDISKDDSFVLKEGCFAKNAPRKNLANTLCISTSPVYSNWECLQYNKTNNTFFIFYSQAFAD